MSPQPPPLHSEFQCQIGLIQLCSNFAQFCCNYFQLCWPPPPDMVRGETPAAPLRFSMPNHLESIVLQLRSIVLAPISRYKGVVFGAQPHCEFRGENGLDQLGFNCAQLSSSHFQSYSSLFWDFGLWIRYSFHTLSHSFAIQYNTVSLNNAYVGTVPSNNVLYVGTVPSNKAIQIKMNSLPTYVSFLVLKKISPFLRAPLISSCPNLSKFLTTPMLPYRTNFSPS